MVQIAVPYLYDEEDKRFLRNKIKGKVRMDGDCWIWLGTTAGVRETDRMYPVFEFKGKTLTVRRISYYAFNMKPTLGTYMVRPSCLKNMCVNPHHMVLVRKPKGGRPKGLIPVDRKTAARAHRLSNRAEHVYFVDDD